VNTSASEMFKIIMVSINNLMLISKQKHDLICFMYVIDGCPGLCWHGSFILLYPPRRFFLRIFVCQWLESKVIHKR